MNFIRCICFCVRCAYLCLHKMDKHVNCVFGHGSIWMECGCLFKRRRKRKHIFDLKFRPLSKSIIPFVHSRIHRSNVWIFNEFEPNTELNRGTEREQNENENGTITYKMDHTNAHYCTLSLCICNAYRQINSHRIIIQCHKFCKVLVKSRSRLFVCMQTNSNICTFLSLLSCNSLPFSIFYTFSVSNSIMMMCVCVCVIDQLKADSMNAYAFYTGLHTILYTILL